MCCRRDLLHTCSQGDHYSGVIIDPEGLPADAAAFSAAITASLSAWRAAGRRGVWLKLPLSLAKLVPEAVRHGFVYHSAEGEGQNCGICFKSNFNFF